MPRGRRPSEFPKVLYSFRLSAEPGTEREKQALDKWLEAELPHARNERAVAIERVILGLIRNYLGISPDSPPAPEPTPALLDTEALEDAIAERVEARLRAFITDLIQDGGKFAMIEQARATYEDGGYDEFDESDLDNILEDFEGRKDGG